MGSSTVTVDGQPIMLKGSCFAQSTGDEAGSAGGVLSSIIKGKAEFINYSFDVTVEGNNVCRLSDMMLLNNRNTPPAPEVQPPLVVLPSFAVFPSESESETKDWDLTKLEYDEEGDDERQEDEEETSGTDRVQEPDWVEASRRGSVARGRTVVLYGDVDIHAVDANGQYDPNGDQVWRLTRQNEASFLDKLRVAVGEETAWNMKGAEFVHVSDEAQIATAMAGADVFRVAWVGHVGTNADSVGGFLLTGDLHVIEGDAFARMIPHGTTVRLLGCDSTALQVQMQQVNLSLTVFPSTMDRQINVNFRTNLQQTVTGVSFSPWYHTSEI